MGEHLQLRSPMCSVEMHVDPTSHAIMLQTDAPLQQVAGSVDHAASHTTSEPTSVHLLIEKNCRLNSCPVKRSRKHPPSPHGRSSSFCWTRVNVMPAFGLQLRCIPQLLQRTHATS
jgi:hypothetical protein